MATKRITERRAEAVRKLVEQAFKPWCRDGQTLPTVNMEFDWFGSPAPTIVWEEGPYDWTMLFPHGGKDMEFGFTVKNVSDKMPKGVYAEPATGWALSLYPEF